MSKQAFKVIKSYDYMYTVQGQNSNHNSDNFESSNLLLSKQSIENDRKIIRAIWSDWFLTLFILFSVSLYQTFNPLKWEYRGLLNKIFLYELKLDEAITFHILISKYMFATSNLGNMKSNSNLTHNKITKKE